MRCAECGLYECCLRTPFGGCPNGEKAEPVEVITTTNTTIAAPVNVDAAMKSLEEKIKFASLPNGPWDKGYQPSGIQSTQDCSTCSPDCKLYNGCYVGNIHKAALNLVDTVERYVKQGCLRSELMLKKDKLKELINGR